MARRVLGFAALFYFCSIAPFQAGAALAWIVVLFGLMSAFRTRDSDVALSRVASPRPVPVAGPEFAPRPSGRRGVAGVPSCQNRSEWADLCLHFCVHRGGTPSLSRYLVIVARERPELWRDLRLTYGPSDEVEILLDRREPPRQTLPRTDRDRRSSLRRHTEVAGQGFWVICRASRPLSAREEGGLL